MQSIFWTIWKFEQMKTRANVDIDKAVGARDRVKSQTKPSQNTNPEKNKKKIKTTKVICILIELFAK